MNFRTFLPFAAAVLAALPFPSLAGAQEAARLSGPVVHENATLFFVHGPSAGGPVPDTLQEALTKGNVEVLETGSVQELKIHNKGTAPVFVQAGDIVKGGQQDRVLTVSMVLQPGSGPVPVGSFCVEQGRWAARGKEDAKKFALSDALMPSREAKVAIALSHFAASADPQRAERLARESEARAPTSSDPGERRISTAIAQQRTTARQGADGQSEVWRSVEHVQKLLSATLAAPVASDSSRTSLQLSLENTKLKAAQDAIVTAIEPAGLKGDDIVGVVVAINGRISGADVYASNALFRKMWPKLARAVSTEALAAKAQGPSAPLPSPEAAAAFLDGARKGEGSVRTIDGIGSIKATDGERVIGIVASTSKGDVVHSNYVAK
jgi:hypothetical protein